MLLVWNDIRQLCNRAYINVKRPVQIMREAVGVSLFRHGVFFELKNWVPPPAHPVRTCEATAELWSRPNGRLSAPDVELILNYVPFILIPPFMGADKVMRWPICAPPHHLRVTSLGLTALRLASTDKSQLHRAVDVTDGRLS